MNPLSNLSTLRLFVEIFPILLATIVVGFSFVAAKVGKRSYDSLFFTVAGINALLLILAQTSWMWSISVGEAFGTAFADNIWTAFNTSVMFSYIVGAYHIVYKNEL